MHSSQPDGEQNFKHQRCLGPTHDSKTELGWSTFVVWPSSHHNLGCLPKNAVLVISSLSACRGARNSKEFVTMDLSIL